MSLFADLPPPTAHLRPKAQEDEGPDNALARREVEPSEDSDDRPSEGRVQEEDEEEHQQTGGAERVSEGAGDGEEPSAKRVKFAAEAAEHDGPSTSGQALPEEQVLLALSKIRSHIGNASKFAKASALLRQLFDTRAITRACRDDAFMVVRAAFPTFKAAFASDVHRDYMRLCHCIDRHQDALSKAQRAHFAIYYIAGMIGNQLNTDDSFQFNKVVSKVKEMVSELPPADEADALLLARLVDSPSGHICMECSTGDLLGPEPAATRSSAAVSQGSKGRGARSGDVDAVEFDPFGLDSLLEEPAPKPVAPSKPSTAWSVMETLAMRRQALLEVLLQAKTYHKLPWARTSVEVLIEHFLKARSAFTPGQAAQLDELRSFVKAARFTRAQGPSQKEINRDSTSFERARAEWSKVEMSSRTKVGAQGDNKSQNWLG